MSDFSLRAVFGLDVTGLQTGLKQARKEFGEFVQQWGSLALAAGAGAFVALSKGAVELAGKLSDASANIGINVISLQALEAQGKRNGVSEEQLLKALEKTKAGVREAADGNVKAKAALDALGISTAAIIKLPLDKQYEAIARAVAKSKNEADSYGAVCEIFGEKVGPKMFASLRELGEVGLPRVTAEAEKAGQIMSTKTIVALDKAGDAIDDWKKRITVAVGNIIVNFRSEDGLELLWLQASKFVLQFGARIVDAFAEGFNFFKASCEAAGIFLRERMQNAFVDAAEALGAALNKVLPAKMQINIGNLEGLRVASEDFSEIIARTISDTKPLGLTQAIGQTYDEAIAKQQKVVDALNQRDFGKDAKVLEDAGKSVAKSIKDAVPPSIPVVLPPETKSAFASLTSAFKDFGTAITRTGTGYTSQSTASLQGVAANLTKQLGQVGPDGLQIKDATMQSNYGAWLTATVLRQELASVKAELDQRTSVQDYAQKYGESAARAQFGDTVTNRSLQDLTDSTVKTAASVDNINKNLASLLGKPTG